MSALTGFETQKQDVVISSNQVGDFGVRIGSATRNDFFARSFSKVIDFCKDQNTQRPLIF
jgi:hypothetical protein